MKFKILLFLCTALCRYSFAYCDNHGLSFTLSTGKSLYYEEDEIFLTLVIENTSAEDRGIEIQYLQPVENKYLFAGELFHLIVEFQNSPVRKFTNHMPPEPKAGILSLLIKPGEKKVWEIPFPYYYYPVNIPGQFRVKLQYREFVSNEVVFDVQKSSGETEDGSLNINPGFLQGKDSLYGWKIRDKKTVHDRENNLLVFHLDRNTAEGEGLWVYSLFYEIESPAEFELKIKVKSSAPVIIIFVEGWKLVNGRKRRAERNECFVTAGEEWGENTFGVVFENREVKWARIKVYAYLNPGDVYFDNVTLNKK